MADALEAGEVRRRLWNALEPVLAEVGVAARGRCDPRRLRYVVQLHPLVLQIVQAADEGRPARKVAAFPGRLLPDGGVALNAATTDLVGAILSGMPPESGEAALLNAVVTSEAGGLVVMFDPSDEAAILLLAEPGKSLGEGVPLGMLGDAPETLH